MIIRTVAVNIGDRACVAFELGEAGNSRRDACYDKAYIIAHFGQNCRMLLNQINIVGRRFVFCDAIIFVTYLQ